MIVVTTPTGQIGRHVLDNLLTGTEPLRVIVRDPARLPAAVRERVEVVRGSHSDPAVVTEAFAGADAVFWVVPPVPQAQDLPAHFASFTRPTCDAVVSRGVARVVGVSTLGRGVAKNAGQISHALAMDELVEATGVHYRALCMPGFMENMLTQVGAIKNQGAFYLPMPADQTNPTCATRDIAAVAARLLADHTWTGQSDVAVRGPEDLSPDDMARIMTEVLGRPVRFQQISGESFKETLTGHGVSEQWAQGLVDMYSETSQGLYHAEPRTPESTTPTTFRQWCTEVLTRSM